MLMAMRRASSTVSTFAWRASASFSASAGRRDFFRSQFGRTLAPTVPHLVQTMRGPNDETARSPGKWSTFIRTSRKH
jgi:hypothetical protein